MRTKISKIIIFLTLLSVSEGALSQEKKGIDEAAALHREYKFEEAIKFIIVYSQRVPIRHKG